MPPSKVIRIDEQVWAELQKLARPLEDTPNSVLRRVLGLSQDPWGEDEPEPRVGHLLHMVANSLGEVPQVCRVKKDYSFLSRSQDIVAYIRPQHEKLRIGTTVEMAQSAQLDHWDVEKRDGFFGAPSFRWYIADGDEVQLQQGAVILEKLWQLSPTRA